jgi:hypothetical protein
MLSPAALSRLAFVASVDPEWYTKVIAFLETNPEFHSYAHLTSLHDRPVGFGKTPGETAKPDMPITMKEYVMYYSAHAGVREAYGFALWKKVRGRSADEICSDPSITDKKKSVLCEVAKLPELTTLEEVDTIVIKGVGTGCKKFIRVMFSDNDDWVDSTDLYFTKGMQKIYNLDKRPTQKQKLTISSKWACYKKVGTMYCNQVASYLC